MCYILLRSVIELNSFWIFELQQSALPAVAALSATFRKKVATTQSHSLDKPPARPGNVDLFTHSFELSSFAAPR